MPAHSIHAAGGDHAHSVWDNSIEPVLEVEPGEEITLEALDASGGQLDAGSQAADVAGLDFARVNPVTGPVFVKGARAGDVLAVEILELRPRDWGWTAIIPGFGLLAEDFPDPWLRISEVDAAARCVRFGDVTLPFEPFPGTIGVAPETPGPHSVIPPSRFGGNIDVRHLTAGATLYLPVGVEGALFSAGDGHAAQGDGEICGSAIETGMGITLRLGVRRDMRIGAPQLLVPSLMPAAEGPVHVTTGVAEDLHEAARAAARAMIERLSGLGLAPEEAYALLSVAGDLRIHEIVNAPRWVVGMALPNAVLAS